MRLILIKFFIIFSLGLSLQGCGVFGDSADEANPENEYAGWNTEKFRTEAQKMVDAGNYEKAIKLYEALESRYPFGESSAQTQLDIAYAYFKNAEPESAIAAADRFIKMNPRNPHVDYAYYLKGLVNYNRDIGFIDRFLPTDTSQRDPGSAREAYRNFEELIRRYPGSRYLADARLRMIALKNNLAMHDVHVARYYMKRKAYVAAINRCKYVLQNYSETPAVEEALVITISAYDLLEMEDLKQDTFRVLQANYPNSPMLGTAVPSDERVWWKFWESLYYK